MLHRALDDSYDADVRAHITLTTTSRTVANGAFRFAPPFLAVIAKGNGVSLAGVGIALAVGELAGLLSPLLGIWVERLQRRNAMSIGLAGVAAASVLAADISGAGATFPYPIYAKWADAYKKETGIGLNYQSIGSGGGIKQIQSKTEIGRAHV